MLDVLFNNAGVIITPKGSETAEQFEVQLETNDPAPFLSTKLLHPVLKDIAKTAPADTMRMVWVALSATTRFLPKGEVVMYNLDCKKDQGQW